MTNICKIEVLKRNGNPSADKFLFFRNVSKLHAVSLLGIPSLYTQRSLSILSYSFTVMNVFKWVTTVTYNSFAELLPSDQ